MSSRPPKASSFGSICTPPRKDYSMNPKVSIYRTNGTGRDTYINSDNGGFLNNITNIYRKTYSIKSESWKASNINPKFSIYKSDGFGRDSYIVSTSGGFFQSTNSKFFPTTLRTHGGFLMYKNNDFINYAQHFESQAIIRQKQLLSKKQRALSARLAKPKY